MKNVKGLLSKFSLADKVAIITGGGAGIGKGIALGFCDVGARVAICERVGDTLEAATAEIRETGGEVLPLLGDVTKNDQVNTMVEKTLSEFGRIDILVNNVGGSVQYRSLIRDFDDEKWDAITAQNLTSVFYCTRKVSRIMMKQNAGNIINIVSVAGQHAIPTMAAYGANKAAIINLTHSLSVELAPYNIRVNSIAPGSVVTPATASIGDLNARARERGTPLGKPAYPEDIALTAIYLASDASDMVTGSNINVDGGPYMGLHVLDMAEQVRKSIME